MGTINHGYPYHIRDFFLYEWHIDDDAEKGDWDNERYNNILDTIWSLNYIKKYNIIVYDKIYDFKGNNIFLWYVCNNEGLTICEIILYHWYYEGMSLWIERDDEPNKDLLRIIKKRIIKKICSWEYKNWRVTKCIEKY
jgi:hypothetical protein